MKTEDLNSSLLQNPVYLKVLQEKSWTGEGKHKNNLFPPKEKNGFIIASATVREMTCSSKELGNTKYKRKKVQAAIEKGTSLMNQELH